MKKKMIALAAALALALSLAACGGTDQEEPEVLPQGTAVEVQTVERGDIATLTTVTGSVLANRDVPVIPKVACEVKEVAVKAGDTVNKGDTLFTMDTTDLRDKYGTLLNNYNSTKTLLDEQIRQTRESVDNLRILYDMGAVSRNQVEQAELGLLQAETSRQTTLSQMGVDDVVELLNDPRVTAPISGTVASVSVTAGVIASNSSVAAVVSEIGRPQVVVGVSETVQPQIHIGDEVDIEITALGGGPVTGRVASVASSVSQGTGLYQVHIDLPEDLEVSIGMFAKAVFRTDARYGAVLVPTETILTDGDKQYVYIVDDGTAYRVEITTGLVSDKQTEVTTGLSGGEQLVTRGQSYLSDGAPVRVTEG